MSAFVHPDAPDAEKELSQRRLVSYTLDALIHHRFPPRKALLLRGNVPIFREGHIGEVYAARGIGKTWLLQTLALVASAQAEALGLHAPEPCRVLYVDGEMASEEVQERFIKLCGLMEVNPPSASLTVVGADWQEDYLPRLDVAEGQALIEPFVANADLIILDNRSCLFDAEGEKDPTAWQPAQDWLLSLRRQGKATLLGHHSNRQGGARGIGKPEDPMNLLLKLTRPEGYTQDQGARFLVEFDKVRGIHGAAAAPFIAALTESGWQIEGTEKVEGDGIERRLLAYLKAAGPVGESPTSFGAWVSGAKVGRTDGWSVAKRLLDSGRVERRATGGFYAV